MLTLPSVQDLFCVGVDCLKATFSKFCTFHTVHILELSIMLVFWIG